MSFYTFARSVVRGILKPVYRYEVIGTENIPSEGGVLLCSNHIDNLDPPTVGITCPRPISFMAKAELFDAPILKTILPKLETFPVKRGVGDREALRKGLGILKEGKVLGLFPEGTRSKDGKLKKGLAGVGFFALRSTADVVPCAIIGPYKAFSKVKVVYGKPLDMSEFRERRASADEVTEAIMSEIAKLIEKYQ
ncbi:MULTISPECIES: lysophospholipid acyltransferase family protein [Priestia]|uniref:lysophospholipid acyltransferase family protein n=1 Tax=Priestia TaxID=2800373 RepID=UPI00078884A3|nr:MULTISPECIES: lysophospholipid acyltransferase family protein [Priestia]MCG7312039.1 1-acyl-sn-glycerol-3-phosphate acyltransferase [Priestia flexa]QCS52108.1 1-acyl-sn-glycerol-3-phosphate acyltransferase [Priestia flexa]SCB80640.1 1-acyl-sn-glycerol-3-phosphate acyltransferase [Priestia flexa]